MSLAIDVLYVRFDVELIFAHRGENLKAPERKERHLNGRL